MAEYTLSARSLQRLEGVHPDLVRVVKRALEITEHDFTVIEGLRTIETQREYVAKGVSKTMNSRHLTGHAVDLYPVGRPTPFERCPIIARAMKQAALELGVSLVWGGDWKSFVDQPHYELNRVYYP